MTLTTSIVFENKVDADKVYGITRALINIPIRSYPDGIVNNTFRIEETETYIAYHHIPCGASAAADLKSLFTIAKAREFCDDGCPIRGHTPLCGEWSCHLTLDTAYGYEPCCRDLHYGIIRRLYKEFPKSKIFWNDEYSGNWFSTQPPQRCNACAGEEYEGYLEARCTQYWILK